eukprot:COSAG05_NODE_354_length_10862_cov_59.954659_2_plen_97_part_00
MYVTAGTYYNIICLPQVLGYPEEQAAKIRQASLSSWVAEQMRARREEYSSTHSVRLIYPGCPVDTRGAPRIDKGWGAGGSPLYMSIVTICFRNILR